VTNSEFTRVLASVVSRPAILPIPSFGPKLLLGGELANALLFTGQRVVPNALVADGFHFAHPTLDVALRALLNKSPKQPYRLLQTLSSLVPVLPG
jgi:NAD dependent epimerase/dehydratase family enzyme